MSDTFDTTGTTRTLTPCFNHETVDPTCGACQMSNPAGPVDGLELDGDWTPEPTFTADYEQGTARIYRKRLHQNAGGVAEVTFRGDLDATACFIKSGASGVPSIYAEVEPRDDLITTIRVAMVPTGKRAPRAHDGTAAPRIGSGNRLHAYLLSVESAAAPAEGDMATAERAADDAAEILNPVSTI